MEQNASSSHLSRMWILQLAVAWLMLSALVALFVCLLCRGGQSTDTWRR